MTDGGDTALVALLRADAVGSTELLTSSGVQAAIDARRRSFETISQCCRRGRLLDTRGDGALFAFSSVGESLNAAWTIQHEHRHRNKPDLRVAVTIAEIDGDEVAGAAEEHSGLLERGCSPGRIVVDGRVVRAVRGLDGFALKVDPLDQNGHRSDAVGARLLIAVPGTVDAPNDAAAGLRAVLFSDMVASESTAPPLSGAASRALHEECVTDNGGVLIDSNGFGVVALFDSCSAALAAAEAVHQAGAAASLRADAAAPVRFRIGLSVGEVTVVNGAAYGVAMVEAARLMGLADSPATLASVDVCALSEQCGGGHRHQVIGPIELKGLTEPVLIDRIEAPSGADPALPVPSALGREHTLPLVGRRGQTAELDRIWTETIGGMTRAAVVIGGEGMGKTRLVQDLATRAHRAGSIVLHGACEEDVRVPFAPLAAALARADGLDAELQAAMADPTGPLGMLMGQADQAGSVASGIEHADGHGPEQHEVFAAASAALVRLAEQRPVLLVIDDIHWAEISTIRMLESIFSAGGRSRLAILATGRAESLDRQHPAQILMRAERAGLRVDRIDVDCLDEAEVGAMLTVEPDVAPNPDQVELAAKLVDISGGNPLYIEELMVDLSAADFLTYDPVVGWSCRIDLAEVSIPDTLTGLIGHRAAQLGQDAVEILSHAAVIGSSFELDLLAAVVKRPIDDVVDVMESAVTARLVREGEAVGVCTFSDEVARAALLRELSPMRQAVVNERVAQSLERLRPGQIDRLAWHWGEAIGPAADASAVRYLRLAAERDMAAAAWEVSVDRHRQALAILPPTGSDAAVLGEVHYGLGLCLRKLGEEAHRIELRTAAGLARGAGLGGLLGRVAIAMMRPGVWYPEAGVVDEEIVAICEDALLLLEPSDPIRARVLAALATNLTYADDRRHRRRDLLVEAQALAREIGDLRLIGTTLAAEAISFQEPDRFERRLEIAEEVRRIGRATGDRTLLFLGTFYLVSEMMARGDVDTSTKLIAELSELVDTMREYFPSFLLAEFEAMVAIARCDPDALSIIEEKRAEFEPHAVGSFGVSVIQNVVVAAGHGELSEMLPPLIEAAQEYDVPSWALKWNYPLSRAYLEAGDHVAAAEAIALNPEPEFDGYWLASIYHLGLLGLLTDDPEVCRSVIQKLSPYQGRFALVGMSVCIVGQISTALGQAKLGLGLVDEAETLFRQAMDQAEKAEFPYFATIARRYLAQALLARDPGDPEAYRLLGQVVDVADRFDLRLEKKEAQLLIEARPDPLG